MVGGSNNVKNTLYLKNSFFFKCYFLNLRKYSFRGILTKFEVFISKNEVTISFLKFIFRKWSYLKNGHKMAQNKKCDPKMV